MPKRSFSFIPRSIKSKYDWGEVVRASGVYECSLCSNYEAFKRGEHFSQCQDCINTHAEQDNKWYVTNELTYFISKNTNIEFDKFSSVALKFADKITEYAGTVSFFLLHVFWFAIWVLANTGYFGPKYAFDPYPFGLLTMIVSLEAIFLSTFILMSQNVASKKSEMRAEHEYQVNLETEKNVAEILAMVKEVRKENEFKHEHIEEIKEAVEDISEHIDEHIDAENKELEEHNAAISSQKLQENMLSTNDEALVMASDISEIVHQELEEHVEKHEKESFEEQEKILDSVGIDIIPESAPPVILEEEKQKIKRRYTKRNAADHSSEILRGKK